MNRTPPVHDKYFCHELFAPADPLAAVRALGIVLAVLLAGCAGDPPPLGPGAVTYSEGPDIPRKEPPTITWWELGVAAFTLAPAHQLDLDVSVPKEALAVSLNLSFEHGVAETLDVVMGECTWRRDVVLTGGQAIAVDCGGINDGAAHVRARVDAGALTGEARVMALVCLPEPTKSACPGRGPVTSG